MFAPILAAIAHACAVVSSIQPPPAPLPPTLGIPRVVHEPREVKEIPSVNRNR